MRTAGFCPQSFDVNLKIRAKILEFLILILFREKSKTLHYDHCEMKRKLYQCSIKVSSRYNYWNFAP